MLEEHLRAARDALANWDLDVARVERVSVSENIAFRVDDAAGRTYVLRLHRPWYHSLEELIAEQTWTAALRAAGVDVPVVVRTRTGEGYSPVTVGDEVRQAGLLEWVEGEVLYDVIDAAGDDESVKRDCFARLGAIMAELHAQPVAWQPPAGFARHAFDADGLMGEQPFWGRFWESPHLSATQQARLNALRGRIRARLQRLRRDDGTFSLIHADLHAANIIVHGKRLHVIDFDDAGFGWHAYDFAVALYGHQREAGFPTVRAALIDGYRSVRPVADETVTQIPLFLLIRSLASIGWTAARPELGQHGRTAALLRMVEEQLPKVPDL